MKRARCVVRAVVAVVSLVGPVFLAASGFAADNPPNIILCMADDQGWGDVGYNGHPVLKTPNLDAMAASGLRLDRFYAAAPVCSPTRGSVLTGRHPNRYGCFSWGHTLRPQEVTIAEVLRKAGYATGHFGKWHLGSVRIDSTVCPGASGFEEWWSAPNFFDVNALLCHRGEVVQTYGESSLVVADLAIRFIEKAVAEGRPFLAVVWFGSPHGPHRATEKYKLMYADQPERLQNYYGEITALDEAVGNLRAALRRLGVADNTIFWYTSDNGATGPGSTGGLRGRKGSLWEGGIRVPCVIEWPKVIQKPRISYFPCGTVDIYPTLLDIVGVKPEYQPPLDGISLRPVIEGRSLKRSKPLGFWIYPERGISTPSQKILAQLLAEQEGQAPKSPPPPDPGKITKQYPVDQLPGWAAWIDWPLKLHKIPQKNGTVQLMLFDLEKDPKEEHDLADQQPEQVKRMLAELEDWQRSVIRSLNGEDYKGQ